jgi:hypothetical protein
MRGCDEIDVVTALVLETQHHLGQLLGRHLLALSQLADFVVLAINAPQIAAGEKDRARALPAAKRRLFPMMRTMAGHEGLGSHEAEAEVAFNSINRAMAGTDMATSQPLSRLFHTLGQLA